MLRIFQCEPLLSSVSGAVWSVTGEIPEDSVNEMPYISDDAVMAQQKGIKKAIREY